MASRSRTQKQIAEKYKGNLDYFRKPHLFRRLRFLLCLLALVGGIAGYVLFRHYGSESFYNAGPLSENHAHLVHDCKACHTGQNGTVAGLRALVKSEPGAPKLKEIATAILKGGSRQEIDRACLNCHKGHQFHQPDARTLEIRDLRGEVSLVRADDCSSCHLEHRGPGVMKKLTSTTCATCHADQKRMMASTGKINLGGKMGASTGVIHQIQAGTRQFVAPLPGPQRPFDSFENGHPPFEYEQPNLRDPNILKFNHQRHEAADIPKIGGQKLSCAFCHKPTGDGAFYGRVSYETSCKACHSLLFDPKNPELEIPHGDPAAVRAYLRSLPFQYSDLAARKGFKSQQEANAFIAQQMLQLKERVRSGEDFEKQVFFTGNPYKTQPTTARTVFPGCAYCHEVKPGVNGTAVITKPVMADRWLLHGEFTHTKHTTMECTACHKVSQSKETSDILMPSAKSCAECHRSQKAAQETGLVSVSGKPRTAASGECLSCHSFHVNSAQIPDKGPGLL